MPDETMLQRDFSRIIPRGRMYAEIAHPRSVSDRLAAELRAQGVDVAPLTVDMADFASWRAEHEHMLPKIDKTRLVPDLLPILDDVLSEKLLEYYLTFRLVPLRPGMRVADLGSSLSAFLRAAAAEHGVQGWAVDPALAKTTTEAPGVTFVPCKVSEAFDRLPMLDLICLHCSFEMFEPSEMEAVIRLAREKLLPGGSLLILPLYLAESRTIYVDAGIEPPEISRQAFEESQDFVGVRDYQKVSWTEMLSPEGLTQRLVRPWPGLEFTALDVGNATEAGAACFLRFIGVWRKPRALAAGRPEPPHIDPPSNYQIELHAGCNLRCPLCHAGRGEIRRRGSDIRLEAFRHILGKIERHAKRMTLHIWGEPTLNPDLIDILRLTYDRLPECVTNISTNAKGLDKTYAERLVDTGLQQLIVSIDGWDDASYAKYRKGGRFQDAMSFVRNCAEHKARTGARVTIVAQCLQMAHTVEAYERFRAAFDLPGVHCAFKPLYTSNYAEDAESFVAQGVEVQQLRIENCVATERFLTVLADGDVVPCCLYPNRDSALRLGNILQASSIEALMNLPDRLRLVEQIRQGAAPGAVCATACGGRQSAGTALACRSGRKTV